MTTIKTYCGFQKISACGKSAAKSDKIRRIPCFPQNSPCGIVCGFLKKIHSAPFFRARLKKARDSSVFFS
jgi:hypothetical protein